MELVGCPVPAVVIAALLVPAHDKQKSTAPASRGWRKSGEGYGATAWPDGVRSYQSWPQERARGCRCRGARCCRWLLADACVAQSQRHACAKPAALRPVVWLLFGVCSITAIAKFLLAQRAESKRRMNEYIARGEAERAKHYAGSEYCCHGVVMWTKWSSRFLEELVMRRFVSLLLMAAGILLAGHAHATVIEGSFTGFRINDDVPPGAPVSGYFHIDTSLVVPLEMPSATYYSQLMYSGMVPFMRVWVDSGAGIYEVGGFARFADAVRGDEYDMLRLSMADRPGVDGGTVSLEVITAPGKLLPAALSLDEIARGAIDLGYGNLSLGGPGHPFFELTALTVSVDGATVPEPTSLLLVACALGLGGVVRMRRRRG